MTDPRLIAIYVLRASCVAMSAFVLGLIVVVIHVAYGHSQELERQDAERMQLMNEGIERQCKLSQPLNQSEC